MKKGNKIKKVFRYFSLLFIVALGLVSIIGTGGGGGGGGGGQDSRGQGFMLIIKEGPQVLLLCSAIFLIITKNFEHFYKQEFFHLLSI